MGATPLLLRRLIAEVIELRVLFFNVHRDTKKSQPLYGHQIAPDLIQPPPAKSEEERIEEFGDYMIENFGGFG